MSRRGAILCGLALVVAVPAPARAEPVAYTVPEALASVVGDEASEGRAAEALGMLESALASPGDGHRISGARARLLLEQAVGLRHAVERLAAGDVPPPLLGHLLHVVAESRHPSAAQVLIEAAADGRAAVRTLAATGLSRSRGPAAVPTLVQLATDPVPAVRAAALRALFTVEATEARDAVEALPVDRVPAVQARRLRWHRTRTLPTERVRETATAAYLTGRTPEERLEGARLLAVPGVGTDIALLRRIILEMGTDELGAALARVTMGAPLTGYDALDARSAAIAAGFAILFRPGAEPALRKEMMVRTVGWLADPVRVEAGDARPYPESALLVGLPELGSEITAPVLSALREERFLTPYDGVKILMHGLSPDEAATAVRSLLVVDDVPTELASHVRRAAAVGLQTLGRTGDVDVARRLLDAQEDPRVRASAIAALGREDEPWAVDVLLDFLADDADPLANDIVRSLQMRAEPRAREALVEYLFRTGTYPYDRITPLVEPADDVAYEVLRRALDDERPALRLAALKQFERVPALRTERGRELVLAYEPRMEEKNGRTQEWQDLLYARIAVDPASAVDYVEQHWEEMAALDWEGKALRTLQNVRGEAASKRVVDLALDKMAGARVEALWTEATMALEGRIGYRDDQLHPFWLGALQHQREAVRNAAIASLDHPGYGDLSEELLQMLSQIDHGDPTEGYTFDLLLDALQYQPWEKVEPVLRAIVLDDEATIERRALAASYLVDRASDETRAALRDWLLEDDRADESLRAAVAHVVGVGASPETAARLARAFTAAFLAKLDRSEPLDADSFANLEEKRPEVALAIAVSLTGDEPALATVIHALLDPRLGRYARVVSADLARPGDGVTAALGRATEPAELATRGLIPEVIEIAYAVKHAPDAALAAALASALGARHATGDLGAFHDAYLGPLAAVLRAAHRGSHAGAAAQLERAMTDIEPIDGPHDFLAAQRALTAALEADDIPTALAAESDLLRILLRRGYDNFLGWRWRGERSRRASLEGAIRFMDGDEAGASASWALASGMDPYGARSLSTLADVMGVAGASPEAALRHAERAMELRLRGSDRPEVGTYVTLAEARARAGDAEGGFRLLDEQLRGARAEGAPPYRAWARLAATVGALRTALEAAIEALQQDPAVAARLLEDPELEPLRREGRLQQVIRRIEHERLVGRE